MLRSQSSMHRLVRHHLVVETKPNGDHRPFGFAFGHGHQIEAHTVLDELQHLVVAQRRLTTTKAHAHRLTQRSSVTTRQTWAAASPAAPTPMRSAAACAPSPVRCWPARRPRVSRQVILNKAGSAAPAALWKGGWGPRWTVQNRPGRSGL